MGSEQFMTMTIATSLDDALAELASGARPIAGGTDLVVSSRQGKGALPEHLVAIDRIAELQAITEHDGQILLGACVTHGQLLNDDLVVGSLTALADAAALIGSPATRNVGTLGGNVMNGSPAMDTGAPLIVLGARAQLASSTGQRSVDLGELWTAPGRTSASPEELCTALVVDAPPKRHGSAYVRLEYRRAMEIAIVGAAASVTLTQEGTVSSLRVALSAVAPTILELEGLDALIGRSCDESLLAEVGAAASEQAAPISDLRATDAYRRHTVGVMARRAVDAAARRAGGEQIAVPVNRALGVGAS